MPFSPGGVFSLVASYFAEPGDTITVEQHNPVFEDVASGLSQVLVRDGRAAMTGPLKVVDGTSSAPGIAFASDPSVGFYKNDSGLIVPTTPLSGVLPIGLGPLPWPSNTAPDGWIFDGATYSRSDYPEFAAFALAAIAGGSDWFGPGDGSTTFTIKDGKGCAIVGADPDGDVIGTALSLGGTVGTNSKTIAKANLPNTTFAVTIPSGQGSHAHVTDALRDNNSSTSPGGATAIPSGGAAATINNATLPAMTGTAASGGSGTPISIVQNSIAVRFIFKAQ